MEVTIILPTSSTLTFVASKKETSVDFLKKVTKIFNVNINKCYLQLVYSTKGRVIFNLLQLEC